jgi:type II secretory pathway component PulF
VEKSILRGLAVIERGGGISEAFSATRLFRANMIGMITAGEKSGSIDKMLGSMASLCEKENAVAVAVMVTVVPVFLYIFIAAYIGYRIVMFYTSYFNKIFSF